VTTNRIQRTARMCVLSTFFALVAFSFLAFGSASAHALAHPTGNAQKAMTVVKIIDNPGAVFSPNAITVKSGTTVKIVNKTPFSRILFVSGGIVHLASRASMTMNVTQSQSVGICGGGSLSITVV
jgi:plastocyanin